MQSNRLGEQILAYIDGEMAIDERRNFTARLETDIELKKQVEEMAHVWNAVSTLPNEEPGTEMKRRYQAMMTGAEMGCAITPWLEHIERVLLAWWPRRSLVQLVFTLALALCSGWAGSYWQRGQETATKDSTAQIIASLNDVSTSERLQGALSAGLTQGDDEVLSQALLGSLLRDPSVNVRRAAVSALRTYGARREVRQALVRVLVQEESAIVRIALIRLLSDLEAVEAVEVMKALENDRRVGEHASAALRKLM